MKTDTEKKNYEVLITGWSTILVIAADSPEEALEAAEDECVFGTFQMDEAKIKRVVEEKDMPTARRYADSITNL